MLDTRLLPGFLLLALIGFSPPPAHGQNAVLESVLTGRNNIQRTGVYDHETLLTPTTVASGYFHRLVTRSVKGQVAAQPLYLRKGAVNGVQRNVLYVVTRLNYIYAFDADNTNANDPNNGQYWANPIHLADCDDPPVPDRDNCKKHPQELGLGAAPLKGMDGCRQTIGPVGITSTPVIDPTSHRIYLVARFGAQKGTPGYGNQVYHYLVTLDLRDGREIQRVRIGDPAGVFVGSAELNRPALLLLNNVLYVAFGAPVCDAGEDGTRLNTHGWVFAYSVPDMSYLDSYNTSPKTHLASIWQSGAGLAGDPDYKFVYALTGNNDPPDDDAAAQLCASQHVCPNEKHPPVDDATQPGVLLGESFLRLQLDGNNKFQLLHHFIVGNWYRLDTGFHCPAEESRSDGCQDSTKPETSSWRDPIADNKPQNDSDLGSGGPVVLTNGFVLGGGKQGRLYLLNGRGSDWRDIDEAFQAAVNTWHQGAPQTTCTQRNPSNEKDGSGQNCTIAHGDYDVGQDWGPNIHGTPAVWERPSQSNGFLYLMAEKDYLRAFPVVQPGRVLPAAKWTSETVVAPTTFRDGTPAFADGKFRSVDGMPGGAVSVSSNGDVIGSGVVWVSLAPNRDASYSIERGMLAAFDAERGTLLWYDPDPVPSFAKFVPPTIAGGKVFVATFGQRAPSVLNRTPGNLCPALDLVTNKYKAEVPTSCGSIVIYGYEYRPADPNAHIPHGNSDRRPDPNQHIPH